SPARRPPSPLTTKGRNVVREQIPKPGTGPPVDLTARPEAGKLWISSPAQDHREARTGLGEWHGQPFAPRRPPAELCVWLVREVNGGAIGEGNHRRVAVRSGSIPGVYRAGEGRRGELSLWRVHRDFLCVH